MSILTPTKPSRFPDGAFYGVTPEEVAEQLTFRDVFDDGQSYGVSAIAEKLGVEEIIIRRKFWERRPDRQSWVVPDVRGRGDYYPSIFGGALISWLETEPRGTFTVSPDAGGVTRAPRAATAPDGGVRLR